MKQASLRLIPRAFLQEHNIRTRSCNKWATLENFILSLNPLVRLKALGQSVQLRGEMESNMKCYEFQART